MSNTYYHRQAKPILYLSAGELTGEYMGDVVYYVPPQDERAILVPVAEWERFYDAVERGDYRTFRERNHKIILLQNAVVRGISFNIVKWEDDTIPF